MVGNLFALRTIDPSELCDHGKPVGPENDAHPRAIYDEAEKIIAAWGTDSSLQERDREVAELLDVETCSARNPPAPFCPYWPRRVADSFPSQ